MDAWDFLEKEGGASSIKEKYFNDSSRKDINDDIDFLSYSDTDDDELDEALLSNFCKKASTSFFEQYSLVSHQISSYNDFVKHGIQQVFNSIEEIMIEPEYDPSKMGDGERRGASLRFGKVTLDRPTFWTGEKISSVDGAAEYMQLHPRHARLQNMTYSSKITVDTHLQVLNMLLIFHSVPICFISDHLKPFRYSSSKLVVQINLLRGHY